MDLLAPEIIEAILEERQPRLLNQQAIRGRDRGWQWQEPQKTLHVTTDATTKSAP